MGQSPKAPTITGGCDRNALAFIFFVEFGWLKLALKVACCSIYCLFQQTTVEWILLLHVTAGL